MSMIKFPYTNLHELNLDWLIEKVKEAYSPDNPPDDVVLSVNGDVGNVILYTDANVQLPDVEDTSWNFFRLADGSAVGIKFNKGLPLERVYGSSRFQIYDTGNPPPYPVTSVNGQTGAITIQIAFGSLTGDTVTFLQSSPDHSWSLDRETLDGSASIRLDTTNDEISAYIEYVSSDDTVHSSVKLLTPADIPSSSGVVSVNGEAGVVVITAEDIHRTGSNSETVEHCLSSLTTDTQNLANKIGSVGSTSLQAQVNTINGTLADIQEDIGTVGETSLQDQIDSLNNKLATTFKSVAYSGEYTCPANGAVNITGAMIGLVAHPTGYTPIAILSYSTNNNNVVPRSINTASYNTGSMAVLVNNSSSAQSQTFQINILYTLTSMVS